MKGLRWTFDIEISSKVRTFTDFKVSTENEERILFLIFLSDSREIIKLRSILTDVSWTKLRMILRDFACQNFATNWKSRNLMSAVRYVTQAKFPLANTVRHIPRRRNIPKSWHILFHCYAITLYYFWDIKMASAKFEDYSMRVEMATSKSQF